MESRYARVAVPLDECDGDALFELVGHELTGVHRIKAEFDEGEDLVLGDSVILAAGGHPFVQVSALDGYPFALRVETWDECGLYGEWGDRSNESIVDAIPRFEPFAVKAISSMWWGDHLAPSNLVGVAIRGGSEPAHQLFLEFDCGMGDLEISRPEAFWSSVRARDFGRGGPVVLVGAAASREAFMRNEAVLFRDALARGEGPRRRRTMFPFARFRERDDEFHRPPDS